ncbi:MAG: alkaline phosphatase D family protein [Gemmataceae bacterium]
MSFRSLFACVVVVGFLTNALPTQAQDAKTLSRIAFGSCASEQQPQPIWKAVVESNPDLFLFIGDNIYGDTQDMNVMREKYGKLAAKLGYQKLLKQCPVMATWDDHDYGVNDGGKEYPKRKESQQVFLDFFGFPKDSPLRDREGIYHAKTFGPLEKRVQIIMLDTRYFRSPLKESEAKGKGPYVPDESADKTLLGEAQWSWLEKELQKPAKLRIIASSIQVVAQDHGYEKWYNLPRERKRLFKLINKTKANGVIIFSGDRHLAELSQMNAGVGYPIYDLTSSGLNRGFRGWRKQEKNQHRVATMNFGNNFGLLTVDWDVADPLIRLQIRDEVGDIMIQHKIPLSVLRAGNLTRGKSFNVSIVAADAETGFAKLQEPTRMTAETVKQFLKKKIRIRMTVKAVGRARSGRIAFLNSEPDYTRPENFTVVIRAAETPTREVLEKTFKTKEILVEGELKLYQGSPQIVVKGINDIKIQDR